MEGGAEPAFSADRTRVSGRRFVAHLVDGVIYALLFVVLILIAGATNDVILAVTFVLGFTVLHVASFAVLQRRSGTSSRCSGCSRPTTGSASATAGVGRT